ncbi:MAG TPA: hypothetical protein VGP08_07600, partial [Pyrinomonadaceae bacterium]|nr:hypothetical protein [Pyrinomonadaceae bacterium]
MAGETPSRELLENLIERIDHLERILQTQTARLYAVEQRLGFEPRAQPRPPGVEDAGREEHAPRQDSQPSQGQPAADGGDAGTQQTPRDAGPRPFEPRYAGPRQQPPPPPHTTGRAGFA